MNETTILVWINIAIIGIIAIIIVKLYFRKDELKNNENSLLPTDNLNEIIKSGKNKIKGNQNSLSKTTPKKSSVSTYFSKQNQPQNTSLRKKGQKPKDNFNSYVSPETHEHKFNNKIESKDEEKIEKPINFNYETKVHKFQEPINESQMDIMSKNKKTNKQKQNENNISLEEKPKHELKDLFSIDELIKESKRKDSEREKESKTIKKEKEDTTEIKESIKQMKEGKKENELITEIKPETENKKEEKVSFYDVINNNTNDEPSEKSSLSITDAIKSDIPDDETEEKTTLKDETHKEENVADILTEEKEENVADALDNNKIKTPSLKTPTKIPNEKDEMSVISPIEEDYEFGAPLEESEIFNEEKEEVKNELNDLDYRKDLAKITNTIKNSKIFNEVKEKLTPEHHINEEDHVADEMYLRNVSAYEKEENFPEYEPIINERHEEYPSDYDYNEPTQEQLIRQENTRKVFNMVKNTETGKSSTHKINETPSIEDIKIKEKPAKNNIKIKINNEEVVLRKGDEIIFNHDGESYSSKVYGIRGYDISVKYRGKKISITSKDIKKIY